MIDACENITFLHIPYAVGKNFKSQLTEIRPISIFCQKLSFRPQFEHGSGIPKATLQRRLQETNRNSTTSGSGPWP